MRALAAELYPWVPTQVLRYPLHTLEHAAKLLGPVMLIHGDKDELIPIRHSEELCTAMGKGKCKAKAKDHKCTLRHREQSKVSQQTMKQMLKAGITADRAKQAAREAACAHVRDMFGPFGKGAK
jgi:pimeloyl-ACP methyl ester carboxylesterase